jgi:hypothetical protein
MSFLKNWFVDRPAAPPPPEALLLPESVPIPLAALTSALGAALAELDPASLDADVARAKLADVCRDLQVEPIDPLELDTLTAGLDRGAWDRFSLCVLTLEKKAIRSDLLRKLFDGRTRSAVREGLVESAKASPLVTLDLLRDAPLRREELARRLILGLGASIAGETLPDARAALERLDYARLMAEADRARRAVRK